MTMTTTTPSSLSAGRLKLSSGWFAAGAAFGEAMTVLSDGAFKLFAYLCLQADRRTGQTMATQRELARALGKSQRVIGRYVKELTAQKVCYIQGGTNQHDRTALTISDPYWPYLRLAEKGPAAAPSNYVTAVRESFLGLGCTQGRFPATEEKRARQLEAQGIPLTVVQDAMVLGACRKYTSLLNGRASAPIASLSYFEGLIAEIQQDPWPNGYGDYVRLRLMQMRRTWEQTTRARPANRLSIKPAIRPGVLRTKSSQQIC